MDLKGFYAAVGGNYEEVISRLRSEKIIKKFVLRFLDDHNYDTLMRSLESGDNESAFRATHTIKGICLNLGFGKLLTSSSALTEALRNGREDEYASLMAVLRDDYAETVDAIKKLED